MGMGRATVSAGALTMQIQLTELIDAVQWAGASPDNTAHVDRRSGRIWFMGDWVDDNDPPPDDLDDDSLYLEVPGQSALGLGRRLALRFAHEQSPQLADQVHRCFGHAGAFNRFKRLLEDHGLLQAWYGYEAAAIEQAVREWAADSGIEVLEDPSPAAGT